MCNFNAMVDSIHAKIEWLIAQQSQATSEVAKAEFRGQVDALFDVLATMMPDSVHSRIGHNIIRAFPVK